MIILKPLLVLFLARISLASLAAHTERPVYRHWPYRIFKNHEHPLMKNAEEVCLFADCSCQNTERLSTKPTTINCTQAISTAAEFPVRIDSENFIDFDQQIELFHFSRNRFAQIPARTFSNLRVACLEIDSNGLELIGSNVFSGIKQLNRLLVTNERRLRVIQADALLPLKYLLLELDLSSNDIDNARMDQFSTEISKLHNLQQLTVKNNLLTSVRQSWFKDLANLDVLNLSANFLKAIEPSAFQELVSLKRISLADNLFSGYFNQTPFESLKTSLVRLDASHNRITQLPAFGRLEKLRYLDFSQNLIESVEADTFRLLSNLYSLDMGSNNISEVDVEAFATLENLFYLRLGDNRLSQVPRLQALTSLVVLDLKNQNGK